MGCNTTFVKNKKMIFENLKPLVIAIVVQENITRDEKLLAICQLLVDSVEYYNWVGFYFANQETWRA